MKIICAGLPKTGTKSISSALQILGYSVFDFDEQWAFQIDEFIQAFDEKKGMPDFRKMYEDADAVMDVPACLFYKHIFKAFPEAKVILMMRDDEEMWGKSISKTCEVFEATHSKIWSTLAILLTPTGRKLGTLWPYVKNRLSLGDGVTLKLKQVYRDHNSDVQTTVPSDQLLVFNPKEGWRPLCKFLGVDVPDVPFPCRNVRSRYVETFIDEGIIMKKMFKELVVLGIFAIVAIAVILGSVSYTSL